MLKLNTKWRPAICALAVGSLFAVPAVQAADADAALALARQNNCFKCHAVAKAKEGPAYKDVAAKYRGKPSGQERIVTHLTTGEKAKFPDGHEEEHKIISANSPAEVKNLADWILSQ